MRIPNPRFGAKDGNIFRVLLLLCLGTIMSGFVAASSCEEYSSVESDNYWDAVARCDACSGQSLCGFCLSTLQCLSGIDDTGPLDGTSCPSWAFSPTTCPALPNCKENTNCGTCADQKECAWCASEGACITLPEALASNCGGLVFDPPCPDSFVATSTVVGNLEVTGDPVFGGGELSVSGWESNGVDNTTSAFQMSLNSQKFDVQSAGDVDIVAGSKNAYNTPGTVLKGRYHNIR